MADRLSHITVSVNTLAKPVPESLLAARTAMRVRPEKFRELFERARAEKWHSEALADLLHGLLLDYVINTDDLWETALYLADEFLQLGDQTLLISSETGQALFKISPEDIWQPEDVSRETGSMAKPLPRLRPDLEGLIIQHQFEKGREEKIVGALAKRVPSTEFLAQEGDNRFLRATRSGRKKIVEMLQNELHTLLPPKAGITGEFLNLFKICAKEEVPDNFEPCEPVTSMARVIIPIVDPLTSNLRFDPFTYLKHRVASQWAKNIALGVADFVYKQDGEILEASVVDTLPPEFWLTDPDTAMALQGKKVLAIEGVKPILLHSWSAPIACLSIDNASYKCETREFLERWEIVAICEVTLYMKPGTFSVYTFKDVPQSGLSVEVVS